MLADMVDEDNEVFREAVGLLSTFGMSREEAVDAVNRLVNPPAGGGDAQGGGQGRI